MDTADIVCIKWGGKYGATDVNRLHAMVARNVNDRDVRFHCFTDDAAHLDPRIYVHTLPVLNVADPRDIRHGYRKEAGLCDDGLGGLAGRRVLFLDLDVLVTGDLAPLIDFATGDEVVMIDDWNSRPGTVGQASCYSWRVGTLGAIKRDFEARPNEIVRHYETACQEWLTDEIRRRGPGLKFWPRDWCRSFKLHALPCWPLRPWATARLPQDCRVLAFHGDPKIPDALVGRWSASAVPLPKRTYKTIRPAAWIADYWHE